MPSLEEFYKQEAEERRKKSRFIKLADGESFEGRFLAVKRSERFGDEKNPKYEFHFLVDGKEKILTTGIRLLQTMVEAKVKEGDYVQIARFGEGFDTKWMANKREEVSGEDIPIVEEGEEEFDKEWKKVI